jgi:hypothetical protein
MANKKIEIGAKSKVASAATPLEAGQKTKTSKDKVLVSTSEPVAVEKVEKGKKAQAAKKRSKEQQMLVKEPIQDQSKVLNDLETTVPSEAKVNDGEATDRKVKEVKVKKQVAVEPVAIALVSAETAPVSKKGTSEQVSEKATKMKRLTLDIAKPLHKAIKAKAVEEGVPMVDMLRSLLEENYSK